MFTGFGLSLQTPASYMYAPVARLCDTRVTCGVPAGSAWSQLWHWHRPIRQQLFHVRPTLRAIVHLQPAVIIPLQPRREALLQPFHHQLWLRRLRCQTQVRPCDCNHNQSSKSHHQPRATAACLCTLRFPMSESRVLQSAGLRPRWIVEPAQTAVCPRLSFSWTSVGKGLTCIRVLTSNLSEHGPQSKQVHIQAIGTIASVLRAVFLR